MSMLSTLRSGLLVAAACAGAGIAMAADDSAATPASDSGVTAQRADALTLDLTLTGTMMRQDVVESKALFVEKQGQVEKIFGIGDEIAEGVVLDKIERDRVLAKTNDGSYWININQSKSSEMVSDVLNSSVRPIDRVDREEFYTPDGRLMEGAAARYYGVDLDAEPVEEVVDLDKRLANLPDDVKLKNGIPETWWNPKRSTYSPESEDTAQGQSSGAGSRGDGGGSGRVEGIQQLDQLNQGRAREPGQ